MPILEAVEVSHRFGRGPGAVQALERVSVAVEPGDAVGIVGESGSGKTTLGRVLVGLQTPHAGEVRLHGATVVRGPRLNRWSRSQRLAVQMIFQDPYTSLNPRMPAWKAVAEAIRVCRGTRWSEARTAAFTLLAQLGVTSSQAEQHPRVLSGGLRQRVSVARSLAAEPDVLIADEPTSAIDQSIQAQLLTLLRALQEERGLAIVLISHDLAVISYMTRFTYVMRAGAVVEDGPTERLLSNPDHPYTRLLLDSVPG